MAKQFDFKRYCAMDSGEKWRFKHYTKLNRDYAIAESDATFSEIEAHIANCDEAIGDSDYESADFHLRFAENSLNWYDETRETFVRGVVLWADGWKCDDDGYFVDYNEYLTNRIAENQHDLDGYLRLISQIETSEQADMLAEAIDSKTRFIAYDKKWRQYFNDALNVRKPAGYLDGVDHVNASIRKRIIKKINERKTQLTLWRNKRHG